MARRKRKQLSELEPASPADVNDLIADEYSTTPDGVPDVVEITDTTGVRRYLVSLMYSPTLEVVADSESSAWEAYKRLTSIRASDHVPKIRVIGEPDGR